MLTLHKYNLRPFLMDDPEEIERINLMAHHPEVAKAKSYWNSAIWTKKKVNLLEKSIFEDKSHNYSFAIADINNKVVGWVWFYQDLSLPLPVMLQKMLGVTKSSFVRQVSYEKLLSTGWPERLLSQTKYLNRAELAGERPGVVVAGLGMAIESLKHEMKQKSGVLYAYVIPNNIASQKVLEKNDFVKVDRMYKSQGVLHQVWIRKISKL